LFAVEKISHRNVLSHTKTGKSSIPLSFQPVSPPVCLFSLFVLGAVVHQSDIESLSVLQIFVRRRQRGVTDERQPAPPPVDVASSVSVLKREAKLCIARTTTMKQYWMVVGQLSSGVNVNLGWPSLSFLPHSFFRPSSFTFLLGGTFDKQEISANAHETRESL